MVAISYGGSANISLFSLFVHFVSLASIYSILLCAACIVHGLHRFTVNSKHEQNKSDVRGPKSKVQPEPAPPLKLVPLQYLRKLVKMLHQLSINSDTVLISNSHSQKVIKESKVSTD